MCGAKIVNSVIINEVFIYFDVRLMGEVWETAIKQIRRLKLYQDVVLYQTISKL
jgi:hypothetical protein